MSAIMGPTLERLRRRPPTVAALYAGNARAVIERGFRVIRNANWAVIATGFFEPVFYLLAMGVGMGALVGGVPGPDGRPISYAMYIAPALLATSAMNGAIYDGVHNVFFKLKYGRLYEGMLATALGPMDVARDLHGAVPRLPVRRGVLGSADDGPGHVVVALAMRRWRC